MPVIAATGLAIASFVIALLALLWGIGWAIYQHRSDGKRDERIHDVETTKAAGIDAIGRAVEAGIDPAAAHERGAALSIYAHRAPSNPATPELYVVVQNLGPGGASLREVVALNRPLTEKHLLGHGPDELLPGGTVELLPGEAHYVPLNLYPGTPWPVEICITWLDGSKTGEKQRSRALVAPPSA
jgi:hypothetical protein